MARELRDKLLLANMYRQRAEELRTIAEGLSCEIEHNLLLTIADDYDRQATSAEARARRLGSSAQLHLVDTSALSADDENSQPS